MKHIRGKQYPITPQCDCWNPVRCKNRGAYNLITPQGEYCPGGPVCKDHAVRIITEYRTKIAEQWGLRAIKVGRYI